MTGRLCAALVVIGTLLPSPAAAQTESEQPPGEATGFFLQGQVAFNLNLDYWGYYVGGSFQTLPILRLGAQLAKLAVAAELNYTTTNFGVGSHDDGSHVISVGLDVQPTLWRSLRKDVRLTLVVGGGAGAAIYTGDHETDAYPLGHLNVGLGVHYLPSRHIGFGIEPGFRVQFVRAGDRSDDLVTVALLYVALSVEAIIGK